MNAYQKSILHILSAASGYKHLKSVVGQVFIVGGIRSGDGGFSFIDYATGKAFLPEHAMQEFKIEFGGKTVLVCRFGKDGTIKPIRAE